MAQLTISKLNDVNVYRDTSSSLLSSDVMEVSLKIDADKYVSSKIGVDDLKTYFVGEDVRQNQPHQMFDIFYRAALDTPFEYQILSGVAVLGSLYSAWPLFIDSSTSNDPSINAAAPNWLNKAQNPVSDTSIIAQYPDFWTKLIALRDAGKILYEAVNVNVPSPIATSLYMTEFNANGYTGRFLIDVTNGFVALPILNNAFIRTVAASGGSISKSETDEFMSHTHYVDAANVYGTVKGIWLYDETGVSPTVVADSNHVKYSGGSETRPKNIRFCPYMQVSNAYTADSSLDVAASLSGIVMPDIATPIETGAFATSALNTKVVSPYGLHEGFALIGNQSLSSNGYQKLPGGLIMQWGIDTISTSVVKSTTFPIPFPNAVFTGSVTPEAAGGNPVVAIQWSTTTTSILKILSNNFAGIVRWFAVGY